MGTGSNRQVYQMDTHVNKQKSGELMYRPCPLSSGVSQTSPRPYNSGRSSSNHTWETPFYFSLKKKEPFSWLALSRREQPYLTTLKPPANLSNCVLCAAPGHPALITVPFLSPYMIPRTDPCPQTKDSTTQNVPLFQGSLDT